MIFFLSIVYGNEMWLWTNPRRIHANESNFTSLTSLTGNIVIRVFLSAPLRNITLNNITPKPPEGNSVQTSSAQIVGILRRKEQTIATFKNVIPCNLVPGDFLARTHAQTNVYWLLFKYNEDMQMSVLENLNAIPDVKLTFVAFLQKPTTQVCRIREERAEWNMFYFFLSASRGEFLTKISPHTRGNGLANYLARHFAQLYPLVCGGLKIVWSQCQANVSSIGTQSPHVK